MDPSGTVHIPISQAMKLIEERGLPVRPNAPPPDVNTQTEAGIRSVDVQVASGRRFRMKGQRRMKSLDRRRLSSFR